MFCCNLLLVYFNVIYLSAVTGSEAILCVILCSNPGYLFTKRTDVLPQNLARSVSRETQTLRLRLRQCLFNQNRYRYHIRFTKNITIYNNHIFLIYNESNARWETSIKVISDRWHRGHPKRNSMHTQWENTKCNFLTMGGVPRRPPPGPPLWHPYYRRDSRTHLRTGHRV